MPMGKYVWRAVMGGTRGCRQMPVKTRVVNAFPPPPPVEGPLTGCPFSGQRAAVA